MRQTRQSADLDDFRHKTHCPTGCSAGAVYNTTILLAALLLLGSLEVLLLATQFPHLTAGPKLRGDDRATPAHRPPLDGSKATGTCYWTIPHRSMWTSQLSEPPAAEMNRSSGHSRHFQLSPCPPPITGDGRDCNSLKKCPSTACS